jgi:hypothetical protein
MRGALLVLAAAVALLGTALLASALLDQPSRYYRDAVVVEAPRTAIWALLTDVEHYDDWNPYITRASGRATVGSELELRLEPAGEDAETHSAKVVIVRPRRKVEWETRMIVPVPGVLDHEQIFRVLPAGPGRWRIVQEARFEGLLAPFADLDGEREGLARMVDALTEHAPRYQSSSE